MNCIAPAPGDVARTPARFVVGLLVVVAAVLGTVGYESLSSSSASPFGSVLHGHHHADHGRLDASDGIVPDDTTVFDDTPAVTNLDPAVLAALRRAATDASDDGVELRVNSGWRSPAYQEQLLRDAVSEYGSMAEAARWVATPETSEHVSGDAVDLGPARATDWLADHGARYGLCQIYRNERWHYELRPDAATRGCPPMYADPAHDPRMQ